MKQMVSITLYTCQDKNITPSIMLPVAKKPDNNLMYRKADK